MIRRRYELTDYNNIYVFSQKDHNRWLGLHPGDRQIQNAIPHKQTTSGRFDGGFLHVFCQLRLCQQGWLWFTGFSSHRLDLY